jgi:hypothetical protein
MTDRRRPPYFMRDREPIDIGYTQDVGGGQVIPIHDMELVPGTSAHSSAMEQVALAAKGLLEEDGSTFGDHLDEFHLHMATHGHPVGMPMVKPGSKAAFRAIKDQFKDVQIKQPKPIGKPKGHKGKRRVAKKTKRD